MNPSGAGRSPSGAGPRAIGLRAIGLRAISRALRCYPAWWRERYGAEQEELAAELAAEGRRPWVLAAGLAAGSVRCRLTGSGMPPADGLLAARIRACVTVATIPAALVLPAALAFYGLIDERGWSDGAAVSLAGTGTALPGEMTAVLLLAVACALWLLADLVILAARLAAVTPRAALRKRAALIAIPFAAALAGLAMIYFSHSLRPIVVPYSKNIITRVTTYRYIRRGDPAAAAALDWAGWVLAAGGWVTGLGCLARLTVRTSLPRADVRSMVSYARFSALLHGTFTLSLIAVEVTLSLQPPIGPHGGLVYFSRMGTLAVPVLALLTASAVLSLWGAASAHAALTRSRALAAPRPRSG